MIGRLVALIPPLYERGHQFVSYIKALEDEFDEFKDAAKDVSFGWVTLNAGTYALNALGRSVGLVRPDWADNEDYRKLVLSMYIARNSRGNYGDIQRIFALLSGVGNSVVLPVYPAGYQVNLLQIGITQEQAELYASILLKGTPSGVGASAFWSDTKYFSWQEDTNPLAGTWGDPWIMEI